VPDVELDAKGGGAGDPTDRLPLHQACAADVRHAASHQARRPGEFNPRQMRTEAVVHALPKLSMAGAPPRHTLPKS